jgi:hypothetical protein
MHRHDDLKSSFSQHFLASYPAHTKCRTFLALPTGIKPTVEIRYFWLFFQFYEYFFFVYW